MNIITYTKPISGFKKFFGIAILIFGFSVFVINNIGGGIILIGIGVHLIHTEGTQINLENKTYRNIISFLGIHIGKWQPIPNFEYVSVFKTTEKTRFQVTAASTVLSEEVIQLNLFYDKNRHINFYKTNSISDAYDVADHFKLALGIRILDATKTPSEWL